jgi:hypothetical protein
MCNTNILSFPQWLFLGENHEYKPSEIVSALKRSHFDESPNDLLVVAGNDDEDEKTDFVLALAASLGRLLPGDFRRIASNVKIVQVQVILLSVCW